MKAIKKMESFKSVAYDANAKLTRSVVHLFLYFLFYVSYNSQVIQILVSLETNFLIEVPEKKALGR